MDNFNNESIKEEPPQLIITDVRKERSEKGITIWKARFFNPGQVPDLATLGLGISQLGAIATVSQNNLGEGGIEQRKTPMVFSIKKISLIDGGDIKTPNGEITISMPSPLLNKKEISTVKNAEIFYGETLIAEAEMRLIFLDPKSLVETFENRWVKPGNSESLNVERIEVLVSLDQTKLPIKLPDLPIPGFGETFILKNRRKEAGRNGKQIGFLKTDPHVFAGHFPEAEIVPLAGSARPAFWMAMQDYRDHNPEAKYVGVTSIKKLSVPAAISPNADFLSYELKPLEKEGAYSIAIHYFDSEGKKQVAAKFGEVIIGEVGHQGNSWGDPEVIGAFCHQIDILEYKDHIALMAEMIKTSVEEASKDQASKDQDSISMADVGTGAKANMAIAALKSILSGNSLPAHIDLHLSDVKDQILTEAKRAVTEYLENSYFSQQFEIHKHTLVGVGKILNTETPGEQDVIFSNFALDYNDRFNAIKDILGQLKSGGQAVLGFVKENPPYYKIFNTVVKRALAQNENLEPYYVMRYIGALMDELNHAGIHEESFYSSIETLSEEITAAGFEIEEVIEDSFAGIGCVFRIKKP